MSGLKFIEVRDLRAERGETFHQLFITTVDAVDVTQNRATLRSEHANEEDGSGAERWRTNELGWAELGRPVNENTVRVCEHSVGAELVEFGKVDGALFVHPVVDEGLPGSLRRDDREEREIVDVESGVDTRMDLFVERHQLGRLSGDIDQLGGAVVAEIRFRLLVLKAHFFKLEKLELQELNRTTGDSDAGVGHNRCSKEKHAVGRVFRQSIFNINVNVFHTGYFEGGCTKSLNSYSEVLQESTHLLHHVVSGGVLDDGGLRPAGSSKECIFGHSIARLIQDDLGWFFGVGAYLKGIGGGFDIDPKVLKRKEVWLDGAAAELAPAGLGKGKGLQVMNQWANEHHNAAGALGSRLVDLVQAELSWRGNGHGGVFPLHFDADTFEYLYNAVHLFDPWHAVEGGGACIKERSTEKSDRAVLGGVGLDGAGELLTPIYLDIDRTRGEGDEVFAERLTNTLEHIGAHVLSARLNTRDGALRGLKLLGEFSLGEAESFAHVGDPGSNVLHMR